LVLGEPSAGHTVLFSQFLWNGIAKFHENGLLVNMEVGETKTEYQQEMMNRFGWDFASAERDGKFSFVDLSPTACHLSPIQPLVRQFVVGREDSVIRGLLEVIQDNVKAIDAKRIVLDPMSMLMGCYQDAAGRDRAMFDLVSTLRETGATCLLSSEFRRRGVRPMQRELQPEEYFVDGVVLMQSGIRPGFIDMGGTIWVERMRETPIDMQPRLCKITEGGLEVMARECIL
jgi:KaiC/GvpD/RAD55 family RecA-like ATPase